jgi:hypothetical protein
VQDAVVLDDLAVAQPAQADAAKGLAAVARPEPTPDTDARSVRNISLPVQKEEPRR